MKEIDESIENFKKIIKRIELNEISAVEGMGEILYTSQVCLEAAAILGNQEAQKILLENLDLLEKIRKIAKHNASFNDPDANSN